MGKIFSAYVKRPVMNWNIENRAQRYLEKAEKRTPPRHPSTAAAFEQLVAEHPEIREAVAKKNEQLAGFLKGMVVNPDRMGEITSGNRKLPEERTRPQKFEFGYLEPAKIRPGRCSIRQALTFLSEHRTDPDEVGSAESIARRYNLDAKRVNNILTHFGVFDIEKPKSLAEGRVDKKDARFSVIDLASDTAKKS